MTIAELIAGRAARRLAADALMARAMQPESLHAAALAYRHTEFAKAAAHTACSDKCATKDAFGVCDAHTRATPANQCVGHRHNRK